MRVNRDSDTICALSTPAGHGGISVIRISGPSALNICRKMALDLPQRVESHKCYLSNIIGFDLETIDQALVTFFEVGRSYTGEETVEISCHGSPVIVDEVLRALTSLGARPADRGEFTYRAFMGGNLDLVQAESVLSLIESKSKESARVSLRQLQGGLSRELCFFEDRLTWCLANLEAGIDFSTEDIEVIEHREIRDTCKDLSGRAEVLLNSYEQGRLLRKGARVAIVGRPNVGKSSLLNYLVGDDRAIVTPIAGTTRDVVEAELRLGGVSVVLQDTAGLRETQDVVEREGIGRSRRAIESADYVLYVFSFDQQVDANELDYLSSLEVGKFGIILNKSDLKVAVSGVLGPVVDFAEGFDIPVFELSCSTPTGAALLVEHLQGYFRVKDFEGESILFHSRHYECLKKVQECLGRADKAVSLEYSPEFIAIEFQEALHFVFEILGKKLDEEILDRVFREFCLGK